MLQKRELIRFLIPFICEQALSLTIGIADMMMVAQCGEAAVSGIHLVDTINQLLVTVFTALATGGAVVAAQYVGSRRPDRANDAARQLLYALGALSAGLGLLCLLLRQPLLLLILGELEPAVRAAGVTYFAFSAVSYPFLALFNAGAALLRAVGDSRTSMYYSFGMNAMNIALNALFIFVLRWGVAGASLATLLSRMAGCGAVLRLLCRGGRGITVSRLFPLRPDWPVLGSIMKIGVPGGLENGVFQIGKILVAKIVVSFGTAAIAANAAALNLSGVAMIADNAVGLALITIVGQNVGAGDYRSARAHIRLLMRWCYGMIFVINALMVLLRLPLLGIYALEPETLALAGKLFLLNAAASTLLHPAGFALPNALRAAGDVRFTMAVSVFSLWMFRLLAGYVLAVHWGMGIFGVYLGMYIDWIFRAVCFLLRCRGESWTRKRVIR